MYNVIVGNNLDLGLILLTYKGKVLLMHRNTQPNILEIKDWCFIGGVKEKHKSFEETICRDVERETSIRLKEVELLSDGLYSDEKKHFYHAELTDENVNDIKRGEGQALDFFTLRELERLNLSPSTKLFVEKHWGLLKQIHI